MFPKLHHVLSLFLAVLSVPLAVSNHPAYGDYGPFSCLTEPCRELFGFSDNSKRLRTYSEPTECKHKSEDIVSITPIFGQDKAYVLLDTFTGKTSNYSFVFSTKLSQNFFNPEINEGNETSKLSIKLFKTTEPGMKYKLGGSHNITLMQNATYQIDVSNGPNITQYDGLRIKIKKGNRTKSIGCTNFRIDDYDLDISESNVPIPSPVFYRSTHMPTVYEYNNPIYNPTANSQQQGA